MSNNTDVMATLEAAHDIRRDFELRTLDYERLSLAFRRLFPNIAQPERYVEMSQEVFPRGCCNLASAYIVEYTGLGEVKHGRYNQIGHTVVKLSEGMIVDITADQFGGPKVYMGKPARPWNGY